MKLSRDVVAGYRKAGWSISQIAHYFGASVDDVVDALVKGSDAELRVVVWIVSAAAVFAAGGIVALLFVAQP